MINIDLGFNNTPVDHTGMIDYPAVQSVVVNLVDTRTLVSLAPYAKGSDNSTILNAVVESFVGFLNDYGHVMAVPNGWTKDTIILALKNLPTIENSLIVRLLTEVTDAVMDTGNGDVELVAELKNVIADRIDVMSAIPIGQYFYELSELDKVTFGDD